MSENWQAGDLALCVGITAREVVSVRKWGTVIGGIYTVSNVANFDHSIGGGVCLDFYEDTDFDPEAGFDAVNFRKVTPPKADEFDREVIDLMTGGKVPSHA